MCLGRGTSIAKYTCTMQGLKLATCWGVSVCLVTHYRPMAGAVKEQKSIMNQFYITSRTMRADENDSHPGSTAHSNTNENHSHLDELETVKW